jgi:hypothetical protein
MIRIKFTDEVLGAADEQTAEFILRSQKVSKKLVTKTADVWTVDRAVNVQKSWTRKSSPLDPDAAWKKAGW